MTQRLSAGIALVRRRDDGWQVLLVHPGGPFWKNKDEHAWSIPKGLLDEQLTGDATTDARMLRETAEREFAEETGANPPVGELTALPPLKLGSGKVLVAHLAEGDLDPDSIESNRFEMEWPPRSGRMQSFPEVDRASWVSLDDARHKLHKGQVGLVDLIATSLPDRAS